MMLRSIVQKVKENENNLLTNGCAYLFGMLGALTLFVITHFLVISPPTIGTVNVSGIIEQFIRQESRKNLPQEILKKEVHKFGVLLDQVVKTYAKQHNVSLFLREAVVAGGRDYTSEINKIMQHDLVTAKNKTE